MCIYGQPGTWPARPQLGESAPQDRLGHRAPTWDDGHDLELRDVLPVRDPPLQQREVVALHHLEHTR